ncbi:MAG: tRNA (adenosine(37)-N6)-dimethylallyltransferase MiaA [Fluviicola sp.]|nr:MAG: tRNA (adenosine(37)-N6)-dimethylallyltransferase MiaA [Fluviicola sp.]
MKKLIVIAGPTASGKTMLSVDLAKQFDCPIISADSRQFYKEMTIGTAKPSYEEMNGVTHYFINSHSIKKPLTAGQFENEAIELITELFKTHDQLILVGGSGMFIDAIVFGTDKIPHSKEVRKKWNGIFEKQGLPYLQHQLSTKDPEYYAQVDTKNPVRLIRALEVIELTNQKYSDLRQNKVQRGFTTHYFVIEHPRELLYDRINMRVDEMISNGLIDEVKGLITYKDTQPLNTVGYKEVFEYLEGNISLERATELIKKNTRNYAKRQLTWFKRVQNAKWIKFSTITSMINVIKTEVHTPE